MGLFDLVKEQNVSQWLTMFSTRRLEMSKCPCKSRMRRIVSIRNKTFYEAWILSNTYMNVNDHVCIIPAEHGSLTRHL